MVDMVKRIWGSETFIDYIATCNLSVYFVLSAIKIDGWREEHHKGNNCWEDKWPVQELQVSEVWGRGHKVTLAKSFCLYPCVQEVLVLWE